MHSLKHTKKTKRSLPQIDSNRLPEDIRVVDVVNEERVQNE